MPFEVGKTLLQVEYRPKKRFAPAEESIEEKREKIYEVDEDEVSSRVLRSFRVL
jgi:fusion and transport protein UGO1